jgi:hypothetical protein
MIKACIIIYYTDGSNTFILVGKTGFWLSDDKAKKEKMYRDGDRTVIHLAWRAHCRNAKKRSYKNELNEEQVCFNCK